MPRIAQYIVLQDAPFTLRKDEHQRIPESPDKGFALPHGLAVGNRDRAILSFVANPFSGAKDLQYEVEVPGGVVTSGQFTGGVRRGLWESFKANNLLAGSDRNFVTFRVLSGDGRVSFEGVVLWYQEDV